MRVRLGLFMALSLPLLFACPIRAQQPDPTVAAADAAYTAKQYASAIALYQQVVASQLPDDVRARAASRIGYAYHAFGDKKQARAAWERAASLFSAQPRYAGDALLRAGNLAAADGDIAGAATLYQRAVDDYAAKTEFAGTIVQSASHLGYMRLKLFERGKVGMEDPAGQLAMREKHAAALAAFRAVITTFLQQTEWVRDAEMNALELMQQGVLCGYGGTYSEVTDRCDMFLKVYAADPKRTPIVMLIRAEALHQNGYEDEAITAIEGLRKAWPAASAEIMGTAQRLLATCYANKGDFERALSEYHTFLDSKMASYIPNADRPYAQYEIGRCLRILGRKDEAIAAQLRVKANYPDSGFVKSADYELKRMAREARK